MDKVLLIDAHNFLWRASIGFGAPITHTQKEETTICLCKSPWNIEENFCYGQRYLLVFNFFRNLRPIIEQFSPDKCYFVLEGHPQFRYDLYTDYKANRIIKVASKKENLEKFFEAREMVLDLMQYLPITIARAAHYECDDTIATLCQNLQEEDLTILSSDTDFIQLLQRGYSRIQIYNAIKKEFMSAPAYPYVAWKCLNGDKSDNIPALLKPKKALACATNPALFKTFMEIEENRANFNINRQLIEFRSIPLDEITLQEGFKNFEILKEKFAEMKFESIINEKSWKRYVSTFDCLRY